MKFIRNYLNPEEKGDIIFKTSFLRVQWQIPVILATWEADVEGTPSLRPSWTI